MEAFEETNLTRKIPVGLTVSNFYNVCSPNFTANPTSYNDIHWDRQLNGLSPAPHHQSTDPQQILN